MSERIKKINSLSRRIISDIFEKDLNLLFSRDILISITGVKIAEDLHNGEVFISILGNDTDIIFKRLCGYLPRIQKIYAGKIRLKFTPKLRLTIDKTFQQAAKIDEIIRNIHLNDKK